MFDFKNKIQKQTDQENSQSSVKQEQKPVEAKTGKPEKFDAQKVDVGDAKIHTMPEKFLSGGKIGKSQKGVGPSLKKNLLLGIIIGVVVIGLVVLGAWFLIKTIQVPETPDLVVEQEQEQIQEEVVEEEDKICSAENCGLCTQEECLEFSEDCHLEDICQEQEVVDNSKICPDYICLSGPAQVEEELEEDEITEFILGRDTDFDLLTDIEEGLWGTDPLRSDTDNDGYNDGVEIENGYNPNLAGSGTGKLSESSLVKTYTNSKFGYALIYPSAWQEDVLSQSQEEVIFRSNTEEFVEVIVEQNYGGFLTAKAWYLNQNMSVNEDDLEEILIGNWSGIRSPDKLNVYIVNNNYVYTIVQNIGLKKELNYKTTFEMMLKSFQLFESPME